MEFKLEWESGHTPADMQDALARFADVLEEELLSEFDDLMESVRGTVQELAPVDSGQLRDSYEEDVETITGGVRGEVSTEVSYAPFRSSSSTVLNILGQRSNRPSNHSRNTPNEPGTGRFGGFRDEQN